jgi:hypothetical protein
MLACQWFSPCALVSSTNKTDCHDITEILSKVPVVLNTIIPILTQSYVKKNDNKCNTEKNLLEWPLEADSLLSVYTSIYVIQCQSLNYILIVRIMVFNATFNNISVVLRQSVLLVEETRLPVENHRPAVILLHVQVTVLLT